MDGSCQCDFYQGYKGAICDQPRCPGWPKDCMGRGSCNVATQQCDCDPGLTGRACEITSCTGDCNSRGTCKYFETEKAVRCVNCQQNSMGDGCELMCVHGTAVRHTGGDWECQCNPCYSGNDCSLFCSGHTNSTTCVDNKCDCGTAGWRGDVCEVAGCPGIGKDCSGHGDCNKATRQCMCKAGWDGIGCDTPRCREDCNNHGTCTPSETPYCVCQAGYFGTACEHHCQSGTVTNGSCVCQPCYNGFLCDKLCAGQGTCVAGKCDCGFEGAGGDFCEVPGCPGYGTCSDHGSCIPSTTGGTGQCICNEGYKGRGCEIPDCPNDCNNRGKCETTASSPKIPVCTQCDKGWMGVSCNIPCKGTQEPMDSGICKCANNCDTGTSCETLCSDQGRCINDSCVCHTNVNGVNPGHWGSHCQNPDCPGKGAVCSAHGSCKKGTTDCLCNQGWFDLGCYRADCPGEPDCSGHGVCDDTKATPICKCNPGWMGLGCDLPCVKGTPQVSADGTWSCTCDACYSGPGCNKECAGHGSCNNAVCVCDSAWWGKCFYNP